MRVDSSAGGARWPGDARCRVSYYEVIQVQWDVRDARHYQFCRHGDGECYLTVFRLPSPLEVARAK